MSLLDGLVGQVIKNSLGNQASSNQNGLGGLLGQVVQSGLGNSSQNSGGLGGLLGQVVQSGLGNQNQSQNNALGGLLGSLLGAQSRNSMPAGDLGSLLGQVLGGQMRSSSSGFNKNALLLALIPVILNYIQQNGGLSGVLNKLNGNGLGNKAQSWVNIDTDNDGIDVSDVMRLFGQDEINQVCQNTGASQNEVCQGIAELLPKVVNDLTPKGDIHADEQVANQEISQILAQFSKNA